MFRRLYFKMQYGSYLRSEHGIKKFAEAAMGQLLRKVTKKSAFYREMNENLLVEKANLRMRADELFEQPMLEAGAFFSVRRQLWINSFIIGSVILAAIFLFLIAVTAFVSAQPVEMGTMAWFVAVVLALVLAGGGLVITERLIESIVPRTRLESEAIEMPTITLLWVVLLVAVELAILGLVEVRADQLALAQESTLLYFSFILLSMLLPVIAGAVRWHTMGYYSAYKTTGAHRQIDSRLAQIDSILRQNEEYESNFYKINSIAYWDLVNEFKTHKDLYNQKHGLVERLDGHFSRDYNAWQSEAYKRYEADIRDVTSLSMRRLATSDQATGHKIGQASDKLRRVPVPVSERLAPTRKGDRNGHPSGTDSDVYLSPKPVR